LAGGLVRGYSFLAHRRIVFFLGIVNTINQTARQSLVNSLVPKDELLNAIGLQSSVFNFSKILGRPPAESSSVSSALPIVSW
jgi:hypothetical protein